MNPNTSLLVIACAAAALATSSVCRADDIVTFDLIPADGSVAGAAGSTVGWGYSITNESPSDWLLTTNLNADIFDNGTTNSLFDFPEVAPGVTVTEPFDPVAGSGLFEFTWDQSALGGFVNSGNFVLSAQWFDGDPFNGGNLIANALDTNAAYSAAVNESPASVPEPRSYLLLITGFGLLAVGNWRGLSKAIRLITGVRCLAIGFLITTICGTVAAQVEPKDTGITRQQGDDILLELRAIHQLLDRQGKPTIPPTAIPVPPNTGKLMLDGEPVLGLASAPITIVEFTDYECPFCRQFEIATRPEILKKYVDTGRVRLVLRDFPLNIHAHAMPAAEAAHCAGEQGQFWPMHDALFRTPGKFAVADLIMHAEGLKLDTNTFRTCIESGSTRPAILKQMISAAALQISATPAFLIGRSIAGVMTGSIILGAQPFSVFEAKLNEVEGAR